MESAEKSHISMHQSCSSARIFFCVDPDVKGSRTYAKMSYPLKYGRFSRVETPDLILEFNLNHEIRHAKSKTRAWLHPSEWLKRTPGNDWVYYSSGGYAGVFEAIGEYYLPNLTYPTNSLLGGKPFDESEVRRIVGHWYDILCELPKKGLGKEARGFLEAALKNTPAALAQKALSLFSVNGSRVTVLPPDARHVDYNLIPIAVSDGCLYKCPFCRVKNQKPFRVRSGRDIREQILALKEWFGADLANYNALFLGEHDALNAPPDLILDTARTAFEDFGFESSFMTGAYLFLFGSADALLSAGPTLFDGLSRLPFQTFINIGLESADQATLHLLGKPLTEKRVLSAFEKAQKINADYHNVEITVNFVMDDALPKSHEKTLLMLLGGYGKTRPKGTVYLSPTKFGHPSRELLYEFYRIKAQSRFPTFLYLIQRL